MTKKPKINETVSELREHLINCLTAENLTVPEFAHLADVGVSTVYHLLRNNSEDFKFHYGTLIKIQYCILNIERRKEESVNNPFIEDEEEAELFLNKSDKLLAYLAAALFIGLVVMVLMA